MSKKSKRLPLTFAYEDQWEGVVAGMDEAGRGPWAGPVVAAAVIVHRSSFPDDLRVQVRDSKLLTPKKRGFLFRELAAFVTYGLGQAAVVEIDQLNIQQATFLAMRRALKALVAPPDHILIDGNRIPEHLDCPATPLIRGDQKCLSIAIASIFAKVTRDHFMNQLHESYPVYGWGHNRGYGTAFHREALEKYGSSAHHRKSFAPIKKFISSQ